jgi:hypothetical protein
MENEEHENNSETKTCVERFIILGDPDNPQNNGTLKGQFISTHWHFYLEDENPDRCHYEAIALVDDQTEKWIFESIIFCYESEDVVDSTRKYALENKVNVSFSYPEKDWIIEEFEKFRPWCQICGDHPCQCGAYYYRQCQYLYDKLEL